MTVLLRTFIVWLLLLALPYQGYASAAMMLCVPVTLPAQSMDVAHAPMPTGAHDHAAMLADIQQSSQHHVQHDSASSSHAAHAHGGVKCGGAACCVAAAPVLAQAIALPVLPAVSTAIVFYSEFLPAVDLAHPERPPQGLRA